MLNANSQDDLLKKTNFNRFQLGLNFSSDVCYRILEDTDGADINSYIIEFRNENETIKFGYTTGLNLCVNITGHVGIETGIQYSNKGYKTKSLDLTFPQSDPGWPTSSKRRINHHQIDIPLKINLTIGKKDLHFISSIGIVSNLSFKETITSISTYIDGHTEKATTESDHDYKKYNISPMISAGIDYRINSNMNLKIEPTFRYGALQLIDAPITIYLWNAGLNISFYVGF